eukprot:CAMPEP_0113665288 /NCGR_PEP_ID=MMETSP0038_2-20120614/2222_1 /TAXON_ID=2898 /ORGANISM="Cryptomonas paramecium" /LENGTH=72 /DNA_ID=CAMNT_0000580625 /DNA_START=13 /DNA_END=231 /DNA_ORIENTATION=+ /assembly_acc=CAM_ASM_000170
MLFLIPANSLRGLPTRGGMALNLVYPWGAESGDTYGTGAAFDGDGVGDNKPAEENFPYNAVAGRRAMPAAFI